jgi:hypothetical protein
MAFMKAENQTAWAKIGTNGKPGSGKTTLLALLAIYLSKTYHANAPVAFIDSEKGSDFLIPIFKAEGVELLVEKTSALRDLRSAARRAKEAGCCALIGDSMTKFWGEAMRALKEEKNVKRLNVNLIGQLKDEWQPFADDFVASPIHYLVAGRLGYDWENAEFEEDGKIVKELVRGGTKMKAEGEFAHDFDLHIEMCSIEDPDAIQYEKLKGKGVRKKFSAANLHVATVKKCRVWALNGQVFRWKDQVGYKPGYYKTVAKDFQPYFDWLNIGGSHVSVSDSNSRALFQHDGSESYGEHKIKCDVIIEKWDSTMEIIAGGMKAEDKKKRQIIGEAITGTRSKTEFQRQAFLKLENQLAVLLCLEQKLKADDPKTESDLVALIEVAKEDVATGAASLGGRAIADALLAPASAAEPF